ncbi:MAG: hypothetical protein ACE5J5_05145 [Candidatus Hydrothermarchaeales archaeon]
MKFNQIKEELELWKKKKARLEKFAKKRGWKISTGKKKKDKDIKAAFSAYLS